MIEIAGRSSSLETMTTSKPLTGDTASLAAEAYVYAYPLVIMEVSRRQQTARGSSGKPGFGASNAFHHMRAFPTADFRAIVRPNFDTLYSSAWLDLTGGPVLIDLPDSGGRYYMLPLLDMWTDVFAVPGSRTTGDSERRIMVIGPGFDGDVPDDALIIEARRRTCGPSAGRRPTARATTTPSASFRTASPSPRWAARLDPSRVLPSTLTPNHCASSENSLLPSSSGSQQRY